MKHAPFRPSARAAFTLLEVAISLAVLAVVFVGLSLVAGAARGSFRSGSAEMSSENRGSRVVRRIVDELRTTDLSSVSGIPAPPFSTDAVDFQINEGYLGQQTVWSGVRRLTVDVDGNLVLTTDLGTAAEQTSHWSDGVAAMLEGEVFNGLDDNGNGLIDEPGLCFSREGPLMTVRLTLESEDEHGEPFLRTWSSKLFCRN